MSDSKDRDDLDSSVGDTLPGRSRAQLAKAAAERRRMGLADTLPNGSRSPETADTPPMGIPVPADLHRGGTFPPVAWDREDVISSTAPRGGERADTPAPGGIHTAVADNAVSEDDARAILTARFTTAGFALEQDYTFQRDDLAVTLDGYDAARRVGFAYLSHADADVVTDFDEATELAFQQLATDGAAHVLVIHDSDTPSVDVLERRIDAFFAHLHRTADRDPA